MVTGVELTIAVQVDGIEVRVPGDATALDAVMAAGVALPHLCKDDNGPALGACRTCLVAIEGVRGTPASCSTPVVEGMVVTTQDPEVVALRKGVLELTLGMRDVSVDAQSDSDLIDAARSHDADPARWGSASQRTRR